MQDSPGEGWPAIHAVDLLVDLRATEAIEPMLELVCDTEWDHISHDRLIQRLPKLGAPVIEPTLALLDRGVSEDEHHSLCCVVAQAGVRDARIYAHLCTLFDRDDVSGAICLGDYGDPAALPLLQSAIEDFEPDFEHRYGLTGLADLVESFELLGGVMTEELRAHVAAFEDEFSSYRLALEERAKTQEQPGRNDPCSCGSGKKFKRCCLV